MSAASLRFVAAALAAMLTPAASTASTAEESHVYGPPPSWDEFKARAEQAVAAKLIDPGSAKFRWAGGYYKGTFKVFLSGSATGYVGCGALNARNRFGGYAGEIGFAVVIDYGRVLFAQIDHDGLRVVAAQCEIAVRNGLVPPLPTVTPADLPMSPAAGATASGLTLRAMPDGAYISRVDAGSASAAAGLKPGMVVTAVNGIPLATMGDAMIKVVSAADAAATLTLAGGAQIRLGAGR